MFVAFENQTRIASGDLSQVALTLKRHLDSHGHGQVIVFDQDTSEIVEVDVRGSQEEIARRFQLARDETSESGTKRGPGRPKLGVIGREVTLLPRHWEWLDSQPGGASVALRKLVEEARRANRGKDRQRGA